MNVWKWKKKEGENYKKDGKKNSQMSCRLNYFRCRKWFLHRTQTIKNADMYFNILRVVFNLSLKVVASSTYHFDWFLPSKLIKIHHIICIWWSSYMFIKSFTEK